MHAPFRLKVAQIDLRRELCDSFNTPGALTVISKLVSESNIYLGSGRANVNLSVVETIATWVTKILRMFGLSEGSFNANEKSIGWGERVTDENSGVDVSTLSYIR